MAQYETKSARHSSLTEAERKRKREQEREQEQEPDEGRP